MLVTEIYVSGYIRIHTKITCTNFLPNLTTSYIFRAKSLFLAKLLMFTTQADFYNMSIKIAKEQIAQGVY